MNTHASASVCFSRATTSFTARRRIGLVEADRQVVAEVRSLVATLDHGGWELRAIPNGRDALKRLPKLAPELVLVGTWFGEPLPLECIKALASAMPSTPLLRLARDGQDQNLFAAFNAGATGCLVSPVARETFHRAVASACEHKVYLCDIARHQLFRDIRNPLHESCPGLSERERAVAAFLADGLREKEIADKLGLKPGTVHEYVGRLYHKLGVHCRLELTQKLKTFRKSR